MRENIRRLCVEPKRRLNLTMTEPVWEKVREESLKEQITISLYVENALKRQLEG